MGEQNKGLGTLPSPGPGQPLQVRPQIIYLRIENHSETYEIELDQPLCLGRGPGPASESMLNLTSLGGVEKGVSRRHARLVPQGQAVMIVDLGSLNGTLVNAQRLASYVPKRLKDGDYIHLGRLLMQVRLP